jgi:hypothetical protein
MLFDVEGKGIAALKNLLGRELVKKRGYGPLDDVLLFRAPGSGPWSEGLV